MAPVAVLTTYSTQRSPSAIGIDHRMTLAPRPSRRHHLSARPPASVVLTSSEHDRGVGPASRPTRPHPASPTAGSGLPSSAAKGGEPAIGFAVWCGGKWSGAAAAPRTAAAEHKKIALISSRMGQDRCRPSRQAAVAAARYLPFCAWSNHWDIPILGHHGTAWVLRVRHPLQDWRTADPTDVPDPSPQP